jgi:hypothetical protein
VSVDIVTISGQLAAGVERAADSSGARLP